MAKSQPTPPLALVASPPHSAAEREPCAVCGRSGIDVVRLYGLTACGNARCQLTALRAQQDASAAPRRQAGLDAEGGHMLRARMILVAVACALAATIAVPAAFGATPQQIYGDYARDGRLDQRYSAPDLRRALGNAALQGYPRVGFKGAVEQALGAQAVERSGGLPFTGLDLALIGAGGALLLVSGTTLVRLGRARK